MKSLFKHILLFVIPVLLAGAFLTSCDNDDEVDGSPVIRYVRVTNPNQSDSLVAGALMGNLIAIIGDNLQNTRELWFNDQRAALISTYITRTSILVNVPNIAPSEIDDKIKLVFADGSTLTYDFKVVIPPPVISSMDLEHVADGEEAVINGDYFFDPVPVVVKFPGSNPNQMIEAEVVETSLRQLKVIVPEGAGSGSIEVTTNFGSTISKLHFRDKRNIILDWDNFNSNGSWRSGTTRNNEHSLDGNYLMLKGVYSANAPRAEDHALGGFVMQLWGGRNKQWGIDNNHPTGQRPEGALFFGEPENLAMKFEAKVVDWYASYMNICWGPWNNAGNQEYWGNLNARAIWGPWDVDDKPYSTNGKWITVTIPMSEFKYAMGMPGSEVVYTPMKFDKNINGTLSFWVLATAKADNSPVEVYIDNVRIVEY
jgi:hypothetical protein